MATTKNFKYENLFIQFMKFIIREKGFDVFKYSSTFHYLIIKKSLYPLHYQVLGWKVCAGVEGKLKRRKFKF